MTSLHAGRSPRGSGRLTGITLGAAVLVVAAVVTATVLRSAFVAAHRTVGWVVACAIVALLIDPLVSSLQRWLPRWLAIIVVIVGLVATVGFIVAGAYREIVSSLGELERAAPEAAAGMEDRYRWLADARFSERLGAFIDELHERAEEAAMGQAIGIAPTYLVTGILMLFILGYGRRYWDGFVGMVSDGRRAAHLDRIGRRAARVGRAYMGWTLLHALGNALVFGIVCWSLNVPAPLSLGVLVGAFTIFPVVGVLTGAAPALLLAFGLKDWWVGAAIAVVAVVLQVIEVVVVRRRVDPRTVRVGPAIPLIVGLLGFELYGVGAAVYAVALGVLALAALDAAGFEPGDAPEPDVSPSPRAGSVARARW